MMEKDIDKQQQDELIRQWTEELLPPDMDEQIADCLLDFLDNDDTEVDAYDLLDLQIHQLAMQEKMAQRNRWKIFFSSVAAVSVAMIIVATIIISTRDLYHHSDKKTAAIEHKTADKHLAFNSGQSAIIADSSKMIMRKSAMKTVSKVAYDPKRKRNHQEKTTKQKEETSELILTETLVEINTGLANMIDNTKECLSVTNVSLLPVNLFSDNNESNSFELISDEYSSIQNSGQMQDINIIETNLINALYEIRNLNINLNFETDNKQTEI